MTGAGAKAGPVQEGQDKTERRGDAEADYLQQGGHHHDCDHGVGGEGCAAGSDSYRTRALT